MGDFRTHIFTSNSPLFSLAIALNKSRKKQRTELNKCVLEVNRGVRKSFPESITHHSSVHSIIYSLQYFFQKIR